MKLVKPSNLVKLIRKFSEDTKQFPQPREFFGIDDFMAEHGITPKINRKGKVLGDAKRYDREFRINPKSLADTLRRLQHYYPEQVRNLFPGVTTHEIGHLVDNVLRNKTSSASEVYNHLRKIMGHYRQHPAEMLHEPQSNVNFHDFSILPKDNKAEQNYALYQMQMLKKYNQKQRPREHMANFISSLQPLKQFAPNNTFGQNLSNPDLSLENNPNTQEIIENIFRQWRKK